MDFEEDEAAKHKSEEVLKKFWDKYREDLLDFIQKKSEEFIGAAHFLGIHLMDDERVNKIFELYCSQSKEMFGEGLERMLKCLRMQKIMVIEDHKNKDVIH